VKRPPAKRADEDISSADTRLLMRVLRERSGEDEAFAEPPARIGIIGAGTTGAKLALEMAATKKFGRTVIAFFDDDFQKWQKRIHEVPVVGMPECLLDGWTGKLDEVVIAMPNASADRLREIDQVLRKASLKFCTVSGPTRAWVCQQQMSD